jgi:hypothetical protein
MDGDLRRSAAVFGLVPDRDRLDADAAVLRLRELVAVWSGLVSQAEAARLYAYTTDNGDGTDSATEPSWHAYRGDRQADYDGSEERYNLSPSGKWYGNLPPTYAAGMTRTARWCPGHRPGECCADSAR